MFLWRVPKDVSQRDISDKFNIALYELKKKTGKFKVYGQMFRQTDGQTKNSKFLII